MSLVENGTHVLFGSRMADYATSEIARLRRRPAVAGQKEHSAALRKTTAGRIVPEPHLCVAAGAAARKKRSRSAGDRIPPGGSPDTEPLYRLASTILDPELAPAAELAALYHDRWEMETAFDELKTHLRGARIVLRGKTPGLVIQEFYGLMMAHFAVRGLMHEAALNADEDPGRLSFLHAVRVVRRKMAAFGAIPSSGPGKLP